MKNYHSKSFITLGPAGCTNSKAERGKQQKTKLFYFFNLLLKLKRPSRNWKPLLARSQLNAEPGKPYWRGKLNTVDLLVLTSLYQLLFILKILFSYVTKQAALMRRSTVLSLPFQLAFPGWTLKKTSRYSSNWRNPLLFCSSFRLKLF
jgi:hypothetical protein